VRDFQTLRFARRTQPVCSVSAISSYSGYEHRHLYFDDVENIQTVASDAVCHFRKKEYLKHLAVKYFGEKEWVFLMKRDEAEIIEEIAEKGPGNDRKDGPTGVSGDKGRKTCIRQGTISFLTIWCRRSETHTASGYG